MKEDLRKMITQHGWTELLRAIAELLYQDESSVSPWPVKMAHMAASFRARDHALAFDQRRAP